MCITFTQIVHGYMVIPFYLYPKLKDKIMALETLKKMMADNIAEKREVLTKIKDEFEDKKKKNEALFQKRTDKLTQLQKELNEEIVGLEKDLNDVEQLSKQIPKEQGSTGTEQPVKTEGDKQGKTPIDQQAKPVKQQ